MSMALGRVGAVLANGLPKSPLRCAACRCCSTLLQKDFQALDKNTQRLAQVLTNEEASPLERRRALSKAITLVESKHPQRKHQADLLLTLIMQSRPSFQDASFRVGFCGPPGAGKSTLIEQLGLYILDQARDAHDYIPERLAVLCVDPSSSITGGSILGDKTRMEGLSRHDRAYIRPSPNAGTFGGLANYTDDVIALTNAAGYSLTFVETVGLGQSEIEVKESVDVLVLVLPPGGGDELQGVKKGIVEFADIVVVTKADGTLLPAAKRTRMEYSNAQKYMQPSRRLPDWMPPVHLFSAVEKVGTDAVWESLCKFRQATKESGVLESLRQDQAIYWFWKNFQVMLQDLTNRDPVLARRADILRSEVRNRRLTPRVAASQLIEYFTTTSGDNSKME